MKQTLKKIVVWLVLLLVIVAMFASCNNSGSDNHTHNSSSSEKETTSSTQGDSSSTEESLSSTEESTSNTELHRHSFGKWVVVKEATCIADGQQERSCSCGEKEMQIIKAKGHTEFVVKGKEATCTESGLTDGKKCSVCGEILLKQEIVTAKGHAWDGGKVTKEPTEIETGICTITCTTCGETKTESIPSLSHTHSYTETVTKPTCTKKGYTTYTCQCGYSYTGRYVIATGHKFGDWTVTKEATCTEKGEETRVCNSCSYKETRGIEVRDHGYKMIVVEPTCTEKGYTIYICDCGDAYIDNYVEAKGHVGVIVKGKEATCTESGLTDGKKCFVCGKILTAQTPVSAKGHSWGKGVITKEPTETETGIRSFDCTACGEIKTETIPVQTHTHSYVQMVTNPTCTEDGYTTYICQCGDSYTDDYVSETGHILGEWTVSKEATCVEFGEETRNCQNCDYVETREIEVKEHDYKAEVTAPTCTEGGYTTYTCSCGDSYIDDYVSETGHILGEWKVSKEATCVEFGEETRNCQNCDYVETREIEVKEHDYKAEVTAPTCTEGGYTTYTCSCGDSYIDDYVSETGHILGEWKVSKEATCVEFGEETRNCQNCDYVETREIEVKEHDYKAEVTAPTCTEGGYTTYTCSCGDSYIDNYVEAKGHSYEAVVTKPTPTEQGYTTYTCACGDFYISDYVDPVPPELPYIVVSNAMGSVGKTVEITIALENNPGLASMKLKVAFDDTALTLNRVVYNDAMGGMSQEPPKPMKNPTTLNWFNGAANSNGDFVYATLTFTVNETAVAGDYEIAVTYDADDVYNIDYDNIDFGIINGKITVDEGHQHSYTTAVTEPTCTEKGYTTYTCSCGDSYTDDYVSETGHILGEWKVTKEATCVEFGEETRNCQNCDYVETREIEVKEHDYEAEVTAPTCTEGGYTTYTCQCGDSYVDNYVNATGHTYINGVCHCGDIEKNEYTVVFKDYDGAVLKTETVVHDDNANPPVNPVRIGYRFIGWDKAFNNVTSNLVVMAKYIQQFTVVFKDYDDTILKTEIIDIGTSANPPLAPSREGYTFNGWRGVYLNIHADQVVQATYIENSAKETIKITNSVGIVGETVSLYVDLSNNSGFISASLLVDFNDTALKLIAVKDLGIVSGAMHTAQYISPYVLTWENDERTSNITANGRLVELVFEISPNASEGVYDITLNIPRDGIINANGQSQAFATINGFIVVSEGVRDTHKWDKGKVVTVPTENSTGLIVYTCRVCGETKTEIIDKLTPQAMLTDFTLTKN